MEYNSEYWNISTWEPVAIMLTSAFVVFCLYMNNIISKHEILHWYSQYCVTFIFIGGCIHLGLATYDTKFNAPELVSSTRHYATIIEIDQKNVSFIDLNTKRYYKNQKFDIPCKRPNGLVGDTLIIQINTYKDSKAKIQEIPVNISTTFCKE
jgi:hypothetical protein